MPSIRSITTSETGVSVTDSRGLAREFQYSAIPKSQDTLAKVESYLKNTLETQTDDSYGVAAHVFSLNPFNVSLIFYDKDSTPAVDWWND
jgi:hypothetical protein